MAVTHLHRSLAHDHQVQFYDDDRFLTTVVSEFLARGLTSAQPTIVFATPEHRRMFTGGLRAQGIDAVSARRSGQLIMFDAQKTLAKFMVEDSPDPVRFRSTIGGTIERALRARPRTPICAYGEMVDLLWKAGNATGAIALEALWNDLAKRYDFSLLCAYSMGSFADAGHAEHFRMICDQHTHVVPTEQYVRHNDVGRLREISVLEQGARCLETEIEHRKALEGQLRLKVAQLEEREHDLRDVLVNAAEGIHLVDREGIILWANQAELSMLGYSADEYVGRHISEFHADADTIADMLQRLTRGETLREYEAGLRCKDGSLRHVLVNSNVRWQDGEFMHTRCFTRDITELRVTAMEREALLERERLARTDAARARDEAEHALLAAEQANRAKGDFLAVMSHELRTPLNAIGGYAELMELGIQGPVTPQQREVLARIQRSQRLLLGLVNQVLNYARIETGNVAYQIAAIPVDETLRGAEALVLPQLRSKGLRFSYAGCDPSVSVLADGEKLQQIMLNLLTNAIKFTDRGGAISMEVTCSREDVILRVRDSGIGIAIDKVEAIFDPFVQIDPNYTRTRDGVGLGLAISRDLARGMAGTLAVESVEGAGSTFMLTLPRAELSPAIRASS